MTTKVVVDRFEGDLAVLLLQEGQEQLVVSRKSLPPETKEGDWLQVVIENGTLVSAVLDAEETARANQRIAEKLDRLRRGE